MSGVYWTLFIELVFYVLCSILYLAGLLERLGVIAGAVLFLVGATAIPIFINEISGSDFSVKYVAFHVSFLFSGALVRMCIDGCGGNRLIVLLSILAIQLCLTAIVTGVFADGPPGFGFFTSHANLIAYGAASIVFLFSILKKQPVSPILVRIGRSSYSLYLLHWPVIVVLLAVLPGSTSQKSVPLILLGTVLSLWVAELSFRFLERPCISIGKYLCSREVGYAA